MIIDILSQTSFMIQLLSSDENQEFMKATGLSRFMFRVGDNKIAIKAMTATSAKYVSNGNVKLIV